MSVLENEVPPLPRPDETSALLRQQAFLDNKFFRAAHLVKTGKKATNCLEKNNNSAVQNSKTFFVLHAKVR